MVDIYKQIVSDDKLSSKFKLLTESKLFDPAKNIIQIITSQMSDKDGNFIQQFQSDGFDSRLWEIYLYALFKEIGFTNTEKYDRPDFNLSKENLEIFVEASLSSEKGDDKFSKELIDYSIAKQDLEIQEQLINYYVVRMGSVLYSKLCKKYWELERVKGKPLVIAITPSHNYLAPFLPDAKLIEYLYGVRQKVKLTEDGLVNEGAEKVVDFRFGEKIVPANFFTHPNSENISGILFTNNSDLHKFNRMAYQYNLSNIELIMVRSGAKHNPAVGSKATEFTYQVVPTQIREHWSESVTLFHNPNAINKIDKGAFSSIRQLWIEKDATFNGVLPKDFVFNSITGVMAAK